MLRFLVFRDGCAMLVSIESLVSAIGKVVEDATRAFHSLKLQQFRHCHMSITATFPSFIHGFIYAISALHNGRPALSPPCSRLCSKLPS